jgi:hypothetical protein
VIAHGRGGDQGSDHATDGSDNRPTLSHCVSCRGSARRSCAGSDRASTQSTRGAALSGPIAAEHTDCRWRWRRPPRNCFRQLPAIVAQVAGAPNAQKNLPSHMSASSSNSFE